MARRNGAFRAWLPGVLFAAAAMMEFVAADDARRPLPFRIVGLVFMVASLVFLLRARKKN